MTNQKTTHTSSLESLKSTALLQTARVEKNALSSLLIAWTFFRLFTLSFVRRLGRTVVQYFAGPIFFACSLCFCLVAHAQPTWFTIIGNPGDSQDNLVEVDPQSRSFSAGNATLNIRVSRAALRTSSDGIPFRSYTATILVNCATKNARFVEADFYLMALWEGRPHTTLTYSATEVRPLLFRGIEPNPAARIIRAACQAPAQ